MDKWDEYVMKDLASIIAGNAALWGTITNYFVTKVNTLEIIDWQMKDLDVQSISQHEHLTKAPRITADDQAPWKLHKEYKQAVETDGLSQTNRIAWGKWT